MTVYSGMETAPFLEPAGAARRDAASGSGSSDEHVAVGTIARLFHLKGHDDLLDLAPELCREVSRTCASSGSATACCAQAFERRIAEMGLQDRFILTGLVPPAQIPELTAAMDVLVHPSRREGLARAIVQGQLAGVPAITYDIDGNREGLIDGADGLHPAAVRCARCWRIGSRELVENAERAEADGRGAAGVRAGAVRREGDGRRAGARVRRRATGGQSFGSIVRLNAFSCLSTHATAWMSAFGFSTVIGSSAA